MVNCCVPFCRSLKGTKGISFHEFPCDAGRRQQWLQVIGREGVQEGTDWVPSDRSVVCSLHFRDCDLTPGIRRMRLRRDAVPSVFPLHPPSSSTQKRRKSTSLIEVVRKSGNHQSLVRYHDKGLFLVESEASDKRCDDGTQDDEMLNVDEIHNGDDEMHNHNDNDDVEVEIGDGKRDFACQVEVLSEIEWKWLNERLRVYETQIGDLKTAVRKLKSQVQGLKRNCTCGKRVPDKLKPKRTRRVVAKR